MVLARMILLHKKDDHIFQKCILQYVDKMTCLGFALK